MAVAIATCHLAQKAAPSLSTDYSHKKQTSFQLLQSNKTATYPTFTPLPPLQLTPCGNVAISIFKCIQSETAIEREREVGEDVQPAATLEHAKMCCILCICICPQGCAHRVGGSGRWACRALLANCPTQLCYEFTDCGRTHPSQQEGLPT